MSYMLHIVNGYNLTLIQLDKCIMNNAKQLVPIAVLTKNDKFKMWCVNVHTQSSTSK